MEKEIISRKMTIEERCLYTVGFNPATAPEYATRAKEALRAKGWVGWTYPEDDNSLEALFEVQDEGMIDHAACLALGGRPAGGPYELQIFDGPRSATFDEYRIRVALTETVESGEEGVADYESPLMDQRVRPEEWRAAIRRALAKMRE